MTSLPDLETPPSVFDGVSLPSFDKEDPPAPPFTCRR